MGSTVQVWKFGGAALADARAIQKAVERIAGHDGPLVVVASALAGVTDLLLSADPDAAETLRHKHVQAARAIAPAGATRDTLIATIEAAVEEFRHLASAMRVLGDRSPRALDTLAARGEQLSARLLAAALAACRERAQFVDALDIIRTNDVHAGATPLFDDTGRRARKVLQPLIDSGAIAVVPGFIGRAPDGSVTTLGRGGTDLTATTLARSLGARQVMLWKDVPGIMTADPRMVADARVIPQLHHREAAEAAHYGAKVLHPRALIPIAGTRITLRVRSFIDPSLPGTEVSARQSSKSFPVKSLAVLPAQAVITVAGRGMAGVHGIAARTFTSVSAEGLSVSTIFQASSESSIGFTVPEEQADRAVACLRHGLREEMAHGWVDGVSARTKTAVIAVVGDGMVGTPGISARVFSALEAGGINVVAIAQGSSERNISFVVAAEQAAEATRRVHAAFQLSKIGGGRPVAATHKDIVLLGFGRVGRALADQIAASKIEPRARIVGLLDRSGYVFDNRGLSRAKLLKLARAKENGALLSSLGGRAANADEALAFMSDHAVSRPVVVDVTSDDTASMLKAAIGQGFDIVLANKRPLADTRDGYEQLLQACDAVGRQMRYEATVGAGLPIIDTYRKLAESGDRVLRIHGCVSGTLTFVMSEVSAGRAFSSAVKEAMARGYAEPDPRDDLSGRDAARKGLILARMMGYRGAAPAADDLVPAAYRHLPLEEFLDRLPELDAMWRDRVARAAESQRPLRYVVSATSRKVTAGLRPVPASSPIGAARGTQNIVTFHSRRYHSEPLVISGPGAGAQVTAAGILNDICSLGRV
ncbi:MAG: aspartate kinase [Cyanobacteria bacterium]|nr:aspartate kinase [Cyanobacteriota bacterium]